MEVGIWVVKLGQKMVNRVFECPLSSFLLRGNIDGIKIDNCQFVFHLSKQNHLRGCYLFFWTTGPFLITNDILLRC